jgi:hypothetical protein
MKRISIILLILTLSGNCTRSFPDGGLLDLLLFDSAPPSSASQFNSPYSVNLSVNSIFTTESGSVQAFTAVLTSPAIADVIVPVSSSDLTEGDVSPDNVLYGSFSLTFTSANWNVPQTVYVKGLPDGIAEATLYTTYNILLGAVTSTDPNYSGFNPTDVMALNYDIDSGSAPGVTVVPTAGLITSESGGNDRFAVVLNAQPATNVIIDLTSSDTTEATVAPASLTFTGANWSTPQMATVTGVNDLFQDGNLPVTITPTVNATSDAAYLAVVPATVSATNADNDTAGITVGASALFVSEGSTAVSTFQVVLNTAPSANVDFNITSGDTTEALVSGDNITYAASVPVSFTTGNWSTPQIIYVRSVDDIVVDGSIAFTVATSAAVSGDGNYSGFNATDISVTTYDNDGGGVPGIHIFPSSGLLTSETGGTAQFGVVLQAMPSANVTIGISSSNTAEGTPSVASLLFTAATWSTPQIVTITGQDEAVADGNTLYSIVTAPAVSTDPNYSGLNVTDVSVTNADNDSKGLVLNTSTISVSESGTTGTFTVNLISNPIGVVTVTITSPLPTEALVSNDGISYFAAIVLTFDSVCPGANCWSAAKTVWIEGVDDAAHDGDINFNVTVDPAGGNYNGEPTLNVSVTNTDNEAAGITVTGGPLNVSENGTNASFTIRLSLAPSAPVTIPIVSSDTAEATVSSTSLMFNATCPGANCWSTDQTITVTGVDDGIADGAVAFTIITQPATSADPDYNGLNGADVPGSNADNGDAGAGVSVTPVAGLVTSEKLHTATFTVVLNSQPVANVKICLASSNTGEAVLVIGGSVLGPDVDCPQARINFTPLDWIQQKTVTVQGVNDAVTDGDKAFTIATAAFSADPGYNGIAVADPTGSNLEIRYVFLTQNVYNGNLGGPAGADGKCMSDPRNPGGTYRAMIADDSGGATYTRRACANPDCTPADATDGTDWVFLANASYYRLNTTVRSFTTNANRIIPFPLLAYADTGAVHWTGIWSDWTWSGIHCNQWSNGAAGFSGVTAYPSSTTVQFIFSGFSIPCTNTFSLICVEQ